MARAAPRRSTHAAKLERWLGADECEHISHQMRDWYGPPIAIAGVPGVVYARGGGDFVGRIDGGWFTGLYDYIDTKLNRIARKQMGTFNAFGSLSDIIAAAAAGKSRTFTWNKVGTTGVISATNSLWRVGPTPAAAANASNAPGGDAPTDATLGAWPFANPTGGDTQHFVRGDSSMTVNGNTLLLYDRLFQVNKTMSSTATEAVTGVPTRYQSTTSTAQDYVGGNFLFVECGAALSATAHNWTVCLYLDQANASSTLPSLTGNSANIINRLDHPVAQWFAPLESGDVGVKALTQMQCSASVTGTINFVIGHPIAIMPNPVANFGNILDGINSAFNLIRIFDDAALALLELMKPATSATTYNLTVQTVAG